MDNSELIILLGPTASGKTRLAVQLARKLNAEIISADSRQVYKDMNIGTGKDLDEYIVDGTFIPYHLINIREAGEEYNIFEFQKDFSEAFQSIKARNKTAILCGGTGLYIDSILKNYQYTAVPINPELRNKLEHLSKSDLLELFNEIPSAYTPLADVSTNKRLIRAIEIGAYLEEHQYEIEEKPVLKARVFGIDISRELRRQRISDRLHSRLQNGMIEEVKSLLDRGVTSEKIIYYGLEYKFITQYLLGEFTYDELVNRLETAIHQFAKRQMTYFRKMERDGVQITWVNGELPVEEQLEILVQSL